MRVYILTEGGSAIGLGHVVRCLSIAEAFENMKIIPIFMLKGEKDVVDDVHKVNLREIDWVNNGKNILEELAGADIVLIDSYCAEKDFYKEVSSLVKFPVYIDDHSRIEYPRGLVINGAVGVERNMYPKNPETGYLLGAEYAPLRSCFKKVEGKDTRKNIVEIMVTFGGGDNRGMTSKVTELLREYFPEVYKKAVIGTVFSETAINDKLDNKEEAVFRPSSHHMKQLMISCDIAVSAGGQTLYELARVGVPTIVICTADNQKTNISGFKESGFIEYAGCWDDPYLSWNIVRAVQKLLPEEERRKRSEIGRKLVDGRGAIRIVDEILRGYCHA